MADKRMIARAISQSRKLSRVSLKAAILWTWAIPWFDGYGYIEAESDFLKLNIVPRRTDILEEEMPGLLRELSGSGLWIIYKDKETGKLIAHDPKFKEFQNLRMDREGKQKFTPGELLDYSGSTPAEDKINEVKIREVNKGNNEAENPVDNFEIQKQKDALLEKEKKQEEFKRRITVIESRLKSKYPRFNLIKFFQANISKNRDAIIHTLERLLESAETISIPEAYCQKILDIESGNYNERESISQHTENKSIFNNILNDIKKLNAG